MEQSQRLPNNKELILVTETPLQIGKIYCKIISDLNLFCVKLAAVF
jgi:hypothetical protein